MRRVWSRLRAMLRRVVGGGASDGELSEELRAFVEQDADSKIRSGMTPEQARRAALIELGGAEQVKEHVREAGAGARWEGIVRDIRYALRSLGRAPGFSLSVIGNLSLGLAAMIVAFAFINGALGPSIIPGIHDQDRLAEIGILENARLAGSSDCRPPGRHWRTTRTSFGRSMRGCPASKVWPASPNPTWR